MYLKVIILLFELKKNIDNESIVIKIVLFCFLNFINFFGFFFYIDVFSMRVVFSVLWCLIFRILNVVRCFSVFRVILCF